MQLEDTESQVFRETLCPHSHIRLCHGYSQAYLGQFPTALAGSLQVQGNEQVTAAAWKLVLGANGQPATVQANIDTAFPLVRPD